MKVVSEAEADGIARLRQLLCATPPDEHALIATVVHRVAGGSMVSSVLIDAGPADLRAAADELVRQAEWQEWREKLHASAKAAGAPPVVGKPDADGS